MTKNYFVRYPQDNRIFEVYFRSGREQDSAVTFLADGFLNESGEWFSWPTVVFLTECNWYGEWDEAADDYFNEIGAFEN